MTRRSRSSSGDDPLDGLRQLRPAKAPRRGKEAKLGQAEPADGPASPYPPVPSVPYHSARRKKRYLRRWPRRILIAANVIVALTLIGGVSAYGYVEWRLGQINHINVLGLQITGHSKQSKSDGTSTPPFTMLVVGSDSRTTGSGDCSDAGSGGDVTGQRSDSIVLVRVIPKTKQLALLSIPRDTLEPIPGYGTTRINTAFNSGNPNLLIQVLNSDFGIEVNHFAEFNFQTFCDVAQAIGGVEQYFPAPGRDYNSGFGAPAGCVDLNGGVALAFVRSREYQYFLNGEWHYQLYPESDLARIQRQQSFIKAAVKKAEQVAPTNPLTLNSLIAGITSNLTLDSKFPNSLIFSLAKTFRTADLTNLPEYTLPTVNSTHVLGALDPVPTADQTTIQTWLNAGVAPAPVASTTTASTTPPTTAISPSQVTIEVANGSGVTGQAGSAEAALTSLGYPTSLAYGAVGYDHAQSVIEYAPDSLAAATQLQQQLVGGALLQETSSLAGSRYDLELVTGQSYNGVTGATATGTPSSSSTSSTTATTLAPSPAFVGTSTINPDSSSTYLGQYIPPGRVPGQAIPNCGS